MKKHFFTKVKIIAILILSSVCTFGQGLDQNKDSSSRITSLNLKVNWDKENPNKYRGTHYRIHKSIISKPKKIISIQPGLHKSIDFNNILNAFPHHHIQFLFSKGVHRFDGQLLLTRGDLSLSGVQSQDTFLIFNIPKVQEDNAIEIRGPLSRDLDLRYSGHGEDLGVFKAINRNDSHINFYKKINIKSGDFILLNDVQKQAPESSLVQVRFVSGNTVHLKHKLSIDAKDKNYSSIRAYKVVLLKNIFIENLTISYNLASETPADYNRYRLYNPIPRLAANYGVPWGRNATINLGGTFGTTIKNVVLKNIASNGLQSMLNLELTVDNFFVHHAYNRNDGGNGYGINFHKTFYSNFENLTFKEMRHSVTADQSGLNAFNNFHLKWTNDNLDFHGGPNYSNIYYIEKMELRAVDYIKDNWDSLVEMQAMEYRSYRFMSASDLAIFNTVTFKRLTTVGHDGTSIHLESGRKMRGSHQRVIASENGSWIRTGHGNDVIIAGSGADDLQGGAGKNTFIFKQNTGKDIIRDYKPDSDLIYIFISHQKTPAIIKKQNHSEIILSDKSSILVYNTDPKSLRIHLIPESVENLKKFWLH